MLLPTSELFYCYSKCATAPLNNLFYCYSNCPTAKFTFFSSATVTALLCYCQLHNVFYCCSNCATVLLSASQFVLLLMCYCATARLPTSQIYLTQRLPTSLRYCPTVNFTHALYPTHNLRYNKRMLMRVRFVYDGRPWRVCSLNS